MKKLFLCASFACLGLFCSCQKDELVPEDSKPEWLGSSIYEELKSATHLTGTFDTYLRLVKDLGYDEVLSRTGSKTIFPANDDAFARFFASKNAFGVTSYEQLTPAMKKQLLYSSMLDNAMLASMLSNVKADDNNVSRGVAVKHASNISVIDSITTIYNGALMPQGNTYWDAYRTRGINVVYDATRPMIVHFTREQMLNNNITTTGTDCDFSIIRGEKVGTNIANSDTAYIFQTRIVNQDVTCQNGYVHQVNDVVLNPGNIGQVLRSEGNTKLFSRIVDYHCAPYYNAITTNDYNSWARQNGEATLDSIFEVRYFASAHSQDGKPNVLDPAGNPVASNHRLNWDLGWNQYYPSSTSALALADMGAILAPTDKAMEEYFCNGGGGAYFIELYGDPVLKYQNTPENLPANLDAMFKNDPNGILTSFVNNLMQSSFVTTTPSKFGTITNQGSGDFMGLLVSDLNVTEDGKYDVAIANNGVVYKIASMIAPDMYQSVLGPAVTYPELSIMGEFASDKTSGATKSKFGADLYYYLMAMKANYLFFIPTNESMTKCYIDPVSLGSSQPRALEFYTHSEQIPGTERYQDYYGVRLHQVTFDENGNATINPTHYNEIANIESKNPSDYASQVYDLLNYNTVVLDADKNPADNEYFLTKHGGAIRIKNFAESGGNYTGKVYGGAQIDNGVEPASIVKGWKEKNGWAFQLDGLIQPSLTSVYGLLTKNSDRFTQFLDLCGIFENQDLLSFAGIEATAEIGTAPQERYFVFSNKSNKALDNNINFFNGYNYTFFAPDDDAMNKAYALGLPTEEQLMEIFEKYNGNDDEYSEGEMTEAKAQVLNMLNALRAFVRYHFQNNSVFADKNVKKATYQSLYSSDLGIPVNITTQATNGVLSVSDASGKTITVDAKNASHLSNKMTRDYEYNTVKNSATSIAVSSTAVVHEISTPLCYTTTGRYDDKWSTSAARKAAAKNYSATKKLSNNFKD